MSKILNVREKYLTVTGLFFITVGLMGIYFFVIKGLKPGLLQLDVFTVYSKYLETKNFAVIHNNQGDEYSVVCYCVGWLCIIFTEKKSFRNKQSLALIIFMIGYLLLHGLAVIYFMVSFLFILPLFFVNFKYGPFFSKH